MCEADLDQVLGIEVASFASPWSRKSFEVELKKEWGISWVMLEAHRVIGYLVAWLVGDEIHVANVAVDHAYRRRGIGEILLKKVIENSPGFCWMELEVRGSNRAARSLYKKLGFHEIGILKRYYLEEGEDAIVMSKVL